MAADRARGIFSDPLRRALAAAWAGIAIAAAPLRAAFPSSPRWQAIRSFWDHTSGNIWDTTPTLEAASLLTRDPRAPVYAALARRGSSFIYPPLAAALYGPFFSDSVAVMETRLAWASRALALGVLAVLLLYVASGRRGLTFAQGAAIAVTLPLFHPLARAVQLNQSTLLITLLIGLAWLALRRGAEIAAGAPLALAIAVKPHLLLAVPLLGWHARKAALSTLGFGAALFAISLAYAGWDNHLSYLTQVLPAIGAGYAFYPNQTWSGFFLRLLTDQPLDSFELAPPSALARGLALAAAAITYGALLSVARRLPRRPALRPHALGLGWLAATLASPIAWEHHYAPAIFLFVASWDAYRDEAHALPARLLPPLVVSFILVASNFWVLGFPRAAAVPLASYVFYGGLLLAFGYARLLDAYGRLSGVATTGSAGAEGP